MRVNIARMFYNLVLFARVFSEVVARTWAEMRHEIRLSMSGEATTVKLRTGNLHSRWRMADVQSLFDLLVGIVNQPRASISIREVLEVKGSSHKRMFNRRGSPAHLDPKGPSVRRDTAADRHTSARHPVRAHYLTKNFSLEPRPALRARLCARQKCSCTFEHSSPLFTSFLLTIGLPDAMSFIAEHVRQAWNDKQTHVVMFSATAIALYGYDQGMMSLINTNKDYLMTMGLEEESPIVGVIVAVYYLGCAVGAVLFSKLADVFGRKKSIFFSLASASLGNLIMFVAGMKFPQAGLAVMFTGRVIMGLGVGGIDAVIPTYSSELSADDARGKALAQEFQSNIFGLVMAFGINLGFTILLGKSNQWAWRIPIIVMQFYPVLLMALVGTLPESPRWFIFNDRTDDAKAALDDIYGDEAKEKFNELVEQHDKEKDETVGYLDMVNPYNPQFHPTMVTIMCQVNQALTGYGAVSVYGPQIFEVGALSILLDVLLTYISFLASTYEHPNT